MKLPLALKLGSTILAVLTGMFLAAGLLASTLASSEIRSLLRTEVLPGVGSTLTEYSGLFTSLLEEEQRQARAQAEEWFQLNGENLARSLLGETFALAEGYDYDAIEEVLKARVGV